MELGPEFWKVFTRLGIPGLALGVLFVLYYKFDFPLFGLDPNLVFWLVLAFLAAVLAVVVIALVLYRPKPMPPVAPNTEITLSVPKGWTFEKTAKIIAGDRLVDFDELSKEERLAPLEARKIRAPSKERAIENLRLLASGRIPTLSVSVDSSGNYLVRKAR